jgi:hypothetical protein
MADINAPFCGPFFQEAINGATRSWAVSAAVIGLVIGLLVFLFSEKRVREWACRTVCVCASFLIAQGLIAFIIWLT